MSQAQHFARAKLIFYDRLLQQYQQAMRYSHRNKLRNLFDCGLYKSLT